MEQATIKTESPVKAMQSGATKKSERINGFDALRTVAMWLGVVLHAVIAYKVIPEDGWPHDGSFDLSFYDWLYEYIHIFRMPLFFLVAGFFGRMVLKRSGARYFAEQRFKRILIPLVVGTIVLVPLTMMPFHFYRFHYEGGMPVNEAWQRVLSQSMHWNGLAHLWFLYYLVIYYVATLLFDYLYQKLPVQGTAGKGIKINRISLPVLAAVTGILYLLLYYNGAPVPDVYTGVKLNFFSILYYGLFYYSGWLIQINMDSIHSLKKNAWVYFLVGSAISVAQWWQGDLLPSSAWGLLGSAVETVLMIAGLMGLFIRYFHAESKLWRYCSDSAYWVYLFHMGIVAALQVFFLDSVVPPVLRPILILVIATFLSLVTYQYGVRYTFIGYYLHGKKTKKKKS